MSRQFILQAARFYELGDVRRYHRESGGMVNETYVLTTSRGRFVVRREPVSRPAAEYEAGILNHIRRLPVPQLVKNTRNNYIGMWQSRPYIVYRYIFGVAPRKGTPDLMRQIGRFQANFHQQGKTFRRRINREPFTYEFPEKKIRKFYRHIIARISPRFHQPCTIIRDILLEIQLPCSAPRGTIHADIRPENVLVKKGKLVGVIDFDNAYHGPLIVDLGKTIVWWCIQRGKINKLLIDSFLGAYGRVRPLTHQELNWFEDSLVHAVASHIYSDYYKYVEGWAPFSYICYLQRELYPFLRLKHFL